MAQIRLFLGRRTGDVTAPTPAMGVSLSLAAGALASAVVGIAAPAPPQGVSLAIPPAAPIAWSLVANVTAPTMTPGVSLALTAARHFQGFLSPDVVHLMSAPMRAQAEKSLAHFIEVTEIDWPTGTMRIAPMPYTSLERGHFADTVRSYGAIAAAASDRSGALGTTETHIDAEDTTGELAALVEGEQANELIGCEVRRYLAHPEVAFDDWFVLFVGTVTKEPEFPSEHMVTITARVGDAGLEQTTPHRGWTIDRNSWPNAHPDAITKVAPRVYGPHDSAPFQTGPGFLTGLLVDTVANIYAFAAGRLKLLDDVFVDDVLTPSGWTMSYKADRRGRIWTVVTFTASQGDAVITANGQGYDTVGDGSGYPMIEDPADILAHVLSNFHFGDWQRGSAWLGTSALLGSSLTSATGVVKTFLASRITTASVCYDGSLTGYEVIRQFCDNYGLRARWQAGKLEFSVEDVAVLPYTGHQIDGAHDVFSMKISKDDVAVSPAVRVDHLRSASQGQFLSSIGVELPGELETTNETDTLELNWSPSS